MQRRSLSLKPSKREFVADQLARLIDTANALFFGVNVKGEVTVWNRKAVDLSGFSTDEVLGKMLVDNFIIPEQRDRVREVLDGACCGNESANFEFPLVTKSGKRFDVLLNATTRRDATGTVTGVVGVGQDITE